MICRGFFGEFLQFNPHLHMIATDGFFSVGGTFTKGPAPAARDLEDLFRYEVLKMLKAEGKINGAVIENMLSWRHSGFNVYSGPTIWPNNDKGLEDLARYIIRACFSQQRMTYLPAKDTLDGQAKVIYKSKDGRTSKTFIEDDRLIKKILKHLGLWETRNHDPPQVDDAYPPAIETELTYDYTYSQLPPTLSQHKLHFQNSFPDRGHLYCGSGVPPRHQ
jgi:hypothetical protein